MNPFHRNEEGAGMADYVSAVAFIAIIAGASVSKLGQNVDAAYGTSSNALAGSGEMLATEQVCSGGVCTRDAAGCFVGGTRIDTAEGPKAIEAVALGDRVGPESAACENLQTDDWREVDLQLTPDGAPPGAGDLQIRLLRSPAWFAENSASVGSQIAVGLEELNIRGLAYVTRIREAPPIEPGSRCPVTGLMRHVSREVISVALQGGAALEVTRHHPLYSAARQDWVEAGELVAGEELITRRGTARVAAISEGPAKPTEVFNLEVMEEHRYFVGDLQVLAHNQCLPWFRWGGSKNPEFTYRGDSRSPAQIFNDGFRTRGPSNDLLLHATDNTNPPSNYISTSKEYSVAESFNPDYIYVIRPRKGKDVNQILGPDSPFPHEYEIAIPNRVKPKDIRSVIVPGSGHSILNPNWKP
jgi:Flp pilus assembly pilin Flp